MKKMKKLIVGLSIATAVFIGITGCSKQTDNAEVTTTETGEPSVAADGEFDGTYTGEGIGHNGKIVIDLTIENSQITAITVKEHSETDGIADAMTTLTAQILASNSFEVDAISGATYTCTGFMEAVEDAFAKSGADKSILVKMDGSVGGEERASEYTADVIVIGAGGAGMISAIEAAGNDVSVIILEKMPMVGGNTLISGAEMAAPANWLQDEDGIEDSADLMYQDTLTGGDNENDPALVRVLADNALDGAIWLRDDIDVEFEPYQLFFGGHSVKRSLVPKNASGVEVITKLKAKVDALDIPVHMNTEATALILDDDGRVCGVKATFNGEEITYSADKGVIIATGGFGANLEMRKEHNPNMDEKILSTNTVGSTGDGIVMAEAIGANIVDMEYIQTYPTCDVESGTLLYVGDVRMEGRSILVNKEGQRFVEELERRDVISMATTEQTGEVSYMFWDEAAMIDSQVNVKHKSEYDSLIERGKLVKADTIEEAADFFDIDAAELQKTIDSYNQYCEDGVDLEFNKRGELVPFTDGPYYIMVSKPAVHHTMGGININTEAQVLNTDGNVIEGLFAAGEVTGDIHGTNRLGSNAIADITVFGRIAGQNVSK